MFWQLFKTWYMSIKNIFKKTGFGKKQYNSIISKLEKIMNDVTDFKTKLSDQTAKIDSLGLIVTSAKTSLDNIGGDVLALKKAITDAGSGTNPEGSVVVSKEDWATINGAVDAATQKITDLSTSLGAVASEADTIDQETPAAESAPPVTDPVIATPAPDGTATGN